MPADKKCKFCNPLTYAENSEWCDKNCDKLSEAIEMLRQHNDWRRGNIETMQPPKRIGEAIDLLLGAFEK